MQILKELNINFLGMKWVAIALSTVAICVSLFFIFTSGITMGIDFSGGHLIQFKFQEMPTTTEIRSRLEKIGLGGAIIQTDQANHEVMIRVQISDLENLESTDEEISETTLRDQVITDVTRAMRTESEIQLQESGKLNLNIVGTETLLNHLLVNDPLNIMDRENLNVLPEVRAREVYGDIGDQLIKVYRDSIFDPENDKYAGIIHDIDSAFASLQPPEGEDSIEAVIADLKENSFIGNYARLGTSGVSPVVGSELTELAIWAVIYSLAGILAYIWFRFNNRFSVAAIVALVHDVIITLGAFAISGREFNLPIVAAVLTIVGYSLNDTIVIFTRIREMLTLKRREAKDDFDGVLNHSINMTLSRTLLTSLTTMIVVLFLFFMGGTVINDFAFTLVVGIIVGTYSSVFVASPVLSFWNMITGTVGAKMKAGAKKARA